MLLNCVYVIKQKENNILTYLIDISWNYIMRAFYIPYFIDGCMSQDGEMFRL